MEEGHWPLFRLKWRLHRVIANPISTAVCQSHRQRDDHHYSDWQRMGRFGGITTSWEAYLASLSIHNSGRTCPRTEKWQTGPGGIRQTNFDPLGSRQIVPLSIVHANFVESRTQLQIVMGMEKGERLSPSASFSTPSFPAAAALHLHNEIQLPSKPRFNIHTTTFSLPHNLLMYLFRASQTAKYHG